MTLDRERAQSFDCASCDAALRQLRNCKGSPRSPGREARNALNGRVYARCPRAIQWEEPEISLLVNTYFDCRDKKTWPAPGSLPNQTAYCVNLFEFLDGMVGECINRENERREREHTKQLDALRSRSGKTPRRP